jgi:hypothetical protein
LDCGGVLVGPTSFLVVKVIKPIKDEVVVFLGSVVLNEEDHFLLLFIY